MLKLDFSKSLISFTTAGGTFTAPQDGWLFGNIGYSKGHGGIKINGSSNYVVSFDGTTTGSRVETFISLTCPIFVKKGQTIAVSNYDYGNLGFYAELTD